MSIANKLTYLSDTKDELKQAINNLGGEITSETTFREYAQELDNIYDNLPKTTGEDTNLSLTTIKGKMNIQVKGDTQQNGTPTPSTPIDIEVVTGTQEVKVENVNLCKNAIVNATSAAYVDILYVDMDLKPNTTYTISFIGATNNKIYLNENITTPQYITCNGSRQSLTFTTKSSLDKNNSQQYKPSANGWILFKNNSSNTETPSFDNVQIEYGSTATSYVEHQEQTQIVSLGDIELCKIGNYQDYLYKSNDKWYKKEYIGKHILSTSDMWALNRNSNNLYQYRTKNDLLEDVITSPDPYSRAVALCNYYAKGDINGMTTQCFNIGGLKYIGITSDISTLANFNTFITNNSIYVYYVCQTPNDVEITNSNLIEQLDNLEKMKSYNGTTNINSSGSLPMILNISALKGE